MLKTPTRKAGSRDWLLEATYGQIRPSVSFVSEARAVRPMKDGAGPGILLIECE